MFLFKIGNKHYIFYKDLTSGKQNKKSTGESDEKKAKLKLKEFENEYKLKQESLLLSSTNRVLKETLWTVFAKEIISHYSSSSFTTPVLTYQTHLNNFYKFYCNKYEVQNFFIHKITSLDIEKYKREREKYIKSSTLKTELTILKAFFRHAKKWSFCLSTPFDDDAVEFPTVPEGNKETMNSEEILLILETAKQTNYCEYLLIKYLMLSGCRASEGANLRKKFVRLDLDEIQITSDEFFTTKNKHNRIIPMTDLLRKFFVEEVFPFRDFEDTDYLFSSKRRAKYSSSSVSTIFKKYIKKLNLKKPLSSHSCRRTYINYLLNTLKGNSIVIMKATGHKHISSLMMYAKVEKDTILHYTNQINYTESSNIGVAV